MQFVGLILRKLFNNKKKYSRVTKIRIIKSHFKRYTTSSISSTPKLTGREREEIYNLLRSKTNFIWVGQKYSEIFKVTLLLN